MQLRRALSHRRDDCASMNPGASARPCASTTVSPGFSTEAPMAAMRAVPHAQIARAACPPVPSIRRAFRSTSADAFVDRADADG